MNKKISIVFFGTPAFAVPTLQKLIDTEKTEILAIFTQPDKKIGRKGIITHSAIKEIAINNKLTIHQPQNINNPEIINILNQLKPDFFIIIAYGQIFNKELINIPKIAALNIHASLLPKYRGASPIQSTLLNGDNITGISIQKITSKLDQGDIANQSNIKIDNQDNYLSIANKLKRIGAELLLKTILNPLHFTKQNESHATFCKKIKKENGKINFQTETITTINNKLRAYSLWPGIFTFWNNKRIKIIEAFPIFTDKNNYSAGTIFLTETTEIGIKCKIGALIIKKLQIEGKKVTNSAVFINGHKNFIGEILD